MGRAAVSTVGEALAAATDALAAAGCETPRLDAELLLADAVRAERATVLAHPELSVSAAAARVAMEHVRRRVAREPVAYILGRKGFRRIELAVDRRVLIPRPETELLVEVALELEQGARVHDVGTGCGAVALALRDERPDLAVSGSDASTGAVELARLNAARLGVEVDFEVRAGLPDRDFDLVAANLPYVREDEWPALAPEIVRYEPREALVAGADGLDAIRSLVDQASPGARLALEHDPRQAATVRSLLRDAHTRRDLARRERVTVGWVP